MVDTPSPERPSEMRRVVRTWLTHLDVERGVSPHTLAAYRRAWDDPACVHAMCNDYRAAIEVDFHDDARDLSRKVRCPALVLYGTDGAMARAYDVAATWAPRLQDMTARAIPGGHFFIDSAPRETAAALLEFLTPLPPP